MSHHGCASPLRAGPPQESCTHTRCAVAAERKSRSSPSAAFSVSLLAQRWILSLTRLCHPTGPCPHLSASPQPALGAKVTPSSKTPTSREPWDQGIIPTALPHVPACSPWDCSEGRGAQLPHLTHGVHTAPLCCHAPSQQQTAPEALQRHIPVKADRPFSSSPALWAG